MTDLVATDDRVLDLSAQLRPVLLRLARRMNRRASTAELTPSRLSALASIGRAGPLRLGELAQRERISKSSVTRLVDRLEEAGYITRVTDPSDGRGTLVDVTAPGREVIDAATARAEDYLTQQLAGLGEDDLRVLEAAWPTLERLLEVKA